jgi:hypothetical protein
MVRNYPVSIGKDLVSVLPLTSEERWRKWANDVGLCGLALASGVPVLQSFYAALARSGRGTFGKHPWVSGSGMVRNSRGLDSKRTPITDEARVGFCQAFGITADHQRVLERLYDDHTFSFSPGLEGYNTEFTALPKHTLSRSHF